MVQTSAGLAFWYYVVDENDPLYIEGQLNTGGEIEFALESGWNLVGNPFTESLTWSDQSVFFSADGTNWLTLTDAQNNGFLVFVAQFVPDGAGSGDYRAMPADGSVDIAAGTGFWVKLDRALTILLKK